MKNLMKKLRSRRGETLVEALCSVLIFTLASVGMYSMVMAANNINATAKEADRRHQEQMEIVEKAEGTSVDGFVTMTISKSSDITNTALATITVPVDIYEAEDLYSYFRAEAGGGS